MQSESHISVLLEESVDALAIQASGIYLDGTFGRGGHSACVLERLGGQGRLLAIDKDMAAIAHAEARFAEEPRFEIEHGSFAEMEAICERRGLLGRLDGVLLDLGVSSPQLDEADRGFSFMQDGPLDMRMNTETGESAADWINQAAQDDIADVLYRYGEERFSRRIAAAIVEERRKDPILSTGRLAEIVKVANPSWERDKHPATRSFLGIRLYINRELEDLEEVLEQAVKVLRPGGRLAVISFHSLEDRIVKRFMRDQARGKQLPPGLPVTDEAQGRTLKVLGKAIKPSQQECRDNPRARSALLRVAERLA